MQERNYSDLLVLIQSLIGSGNLTTEEQTAVLSFVNRRAHEAYQTSQTWPRYLVVGEERAISTTLAQTIPYSEADKDNIAEFLRIYRTQPSLNLTAKEYEFYVDSNGAHILNITTTDASSAFVTYQKELPLFTATSTNIPGEWFFFIAHASYADFLRLDGQTDKAMAEEQVAQTYLAMELERVNNMVNNNNLFNKFSTHGTRQSR